MAAVSCALALLGGAVGAGFASGREIVCFFAAHGHYAGVALLSSLCMFCGLFSLLGARLAQKRIDSLAALCVHAFGPRLGALCGALFFLLSAVTGGAMLAACAELGSLTLPMRSAYALTLLFSLALALLLSRRSLAGAALPGSVLLVLLPVLLVLLLALPRGEARFLPAPSRLQPVPAILFGALYGALNTAMLAGLLPALAALDAKQRRRSVLLFGTLFGALLYLAVLVCRRHFAAVLWQPLPFVYMSRQLGSGGYLLVAACLYTAALSTLCAMLSGMRRMTARPHAVLCAAACLLFSFSGFDHLISSAYPALGALCGALLLVLCFTP